MRRHNCYVYILTNPGKDVLYTGMTNNLGQRIIEHYLNRGKFKTFAGRYYVYLLLYYEHYQYVNDAYSREKEIKGWSRKKKMELIKSANPHLEILNASIIDPWPPKDPTPRVY